ncbi:MAG: hypothetical protein JWR38_2834 [Mucilaginibacter sp.]|nr:hypothetical protein [Mucilaginibacter sp.]
MKKLLLLGMFVTCIGSASAQGPTISLVGNSPMINKGTIDMEVLTQVIQQKQEEVKQHVFRNTIIKEFNDHSYLDHLKNYTTYSFIYHLMDIMTSGKNKTVITKKIIQDASEFAYIYGMVMYVQQNYKANKVLVALDDKFSIGPNFIEAAKVRVNQNDRQSNVTIPPDIKNFNLMIDLCYDIVVHDDNLHPGFTFSADLDDPTFKTWYDADNVYLVERNKAGPAGQPKFDAEKTSIQFLLQQFTAKIKQAGQLLQALKTLSNSPDHNLATATTTLLSTYGDLSASDLQAKINELISKFDGSIPADQKFTLNSAYNTIKDNYDQYKPLYTFYTQLQKSDFKDFTLTQDQYYALKAITLDFLKLVRHQFKNDVVGSVLDFLIENTIVEYNSNSTNNPIPEKTATINDKGYIYIDIDALVSAIEQHFAPSDKKAVYVSVFFSLGTNQASFLNKNSLATDNNGNPKSLGNLYYASEKIGIKYKFWNWRYTHSFQPGENFNYYNKPGTYPRSWLRPQQQPTISDVYIMFYGSGLLYNLVNLKSEDKFNYAIAGAGLGITFFNGLSLNVGLACPYTDKRFKGENTFVNFGIDIPIIDYIAALAKK